LTFVVVNSSYCCHHVWSFISKLRAVIHVLISSLARRTSKNPRRTTVANLTRKFQQCKNHKFSKVKYNSPLQHALWQTPEALPFSPLKQGLPFKHCLIKLFGEGQISGIGEIWFRVWIQQNLISWLSREQSS